MDVLILGMTCHHQNCFRNWLSSQNDTIKRYCSLYTCCFYICQRIIFLDFFEFFKLAFWPWQWPWIMIPKLRSHQKNSLHLSLFISLLKNHIWPWNCYVTDAILDAILDFWLFRSAYFLRFLIWKCVVFPKFKSVKILYAAISSRLRRFFFILESSWRLHM